MQPSQYMEAKINETGLFMAQPRGFLNYIQILIKMPKMVLKDVEKVNRGKNTENSQNL